MSLYKNFIWIAVIIWIAIIFSLSSQVTQQSNQLSKGITQVIVKVIKKVVPTAEFNVREFNYIVRKNAHFIAYLILGILAISALKRSGVHGYHRLIVALMICVLYALSDEMHQLFVQGRNGQVKDIIIDSMGACIGIAIGMFFSKTKR